MILLFSTVHPDYPLYSRDFLRACCWRTGMLVNFGYRDTRLPGKLSSEGQTGIIVFGEYDESTEDYIYHPVRKVAIKQVDERRSGKTFGLLLGPFFDYRDTPAITSLVNALRSFYSTANDSPSTKRPVGDRRFVHIHDPWPTQDPFSEELEARDALIDRFSTLQGLQDKFFMFSDDYHADGWMTLRPNGESTHTWTGGARYCLSLLVRPGNKATFRAPIVEVPSAICSVSGPFTAQQDTGFSAKFFFICKRSFEPDSGMLVVKIAPSQDDKTGIVSPELQERVELNPPKNMLLSVIMFGVVGSVGTSVGPKLPEPWNYFAAIIAALAVAVALYLGFRKLPLGK